MNTAAPLARVHALWTLDGLGALDDASIASAMRDAAPGVLAHAGTAVAAPDSAGKISAMQPDVDFDVDPHALLEALGERAVLLEPLRRIEQPL